ncbi:MAG: glycosyltransferase [Alphaproteobacteria bacterium]|nr:glycosyltransferase [Alphaproteobacteria bacterium]
MNQSTVSLITVVLNGGTAFERAAESVFAQSYRPIEYIVIDGGSTDSTVDVIRSYGDRVSHWVSEPDRGISHAFNKGIAASTGHYVGFINADDWLERNQIEEAVHALESREADFVFGDLAYHDADGRLLHIIKGDPHYAARIHSRMPALNHPTVLARHTIFEGIGGFEERYKVAMDYDWALRAHLAGYRGRYAPSVFGHMTLEGTSDRRFIEGLAEVRAIAVNHGQPAMKAWPLFGYRVVKGITQRIIQRHAPPSLYDRLRGWVNPDYRALPQASGSPSGAETSRP